VSRHARNLNSNHLTARVSLSNVSEPSTSESHEIDIVVQTLVCLLVVWNMASIEREASKRREGTI